MRKRTVISFAVFVLVIVSALAEGYVYEFPEDARSFSLSYANIVTATETGQNGDALYRVSRVIDGDTIDVEKDGERTRVRLIGIDTPETVDPRRPVECFGKEASLRARELLEGNMVHLVTDPSQGLYDRYKRMLAYVYLSNGAFFNEAMISEGYAHEYTYRLPYRYQTEFKAAERTAREQKRGLWADRLCAEI